MLVQCIASDVNKLTDMAMRKRLIETIHLEGGDTNLVIGKIYPVFALDWWSDGGIRVYLHTIEENDHPYPYPLEFFNVVDPALPANWSVSFEQQPFGVAIKRISFHEWASDAHFYERLIDGDETAIAIYKHQRA